MNPVRSATSVLRNLFNFSGRASRSEFWWVFLIVVVVGLVLLNQYLELSLPRSPINFDPVHIAISIIQSLLGLAVILPVVYLVVMPAVAARRLHDTGRSARWLLIPCVVILGWAIIVGIATLDGSPFFDDGWGGGNRCCGFRGNLGPDRPGWYGGADHRTGRAGRRRSQSLRARPTAA